MKYKFNLLWTPWYIGSEMMGRLHAIAPLTSGTGFGCVWEDVDLSLVITNGSMRFLLKLKHWQLFLITWGIPVCVFSFASPELMVKLFPLMMIVFIIGIFGWIWAISTQLHKKLPMEVDLNIRGFKIIFSIPILYTIALTVWMVYQFYFRFPEGSSNVGSVIFVVAFIHFVSMICILVGLRFAAQTLRSVELGRLARFSEYSIEFFLIWFSPIGFWILQPRLNKLVGK